MVLSGLHVWALLLAKQHIYACCICTNQQDDKGANAEDPNHSSSADFEISADQGQPLHLPCGREVVKDIQRYSISIPQPSGSIMNSSGTSGS